MKEEKILQLTKIDNKENSSKNFLLGEWCKKYDVIEKNKHNGFVQGHHWKNKSKRSKDLIYIENLYEKLIVHLKNALNDFHEVKKDELYWRVIVGPWLLRYITVLFDRWETISNFFSENSHNFKINSYRNNTHNLRVFENWPVFLENAAYRNEWNHFIYATIIENYYLDKVQINKINFELDSHKTFIKNRRPEFPITQAYEAQDIEVKSTGSTNLAILLKKLIKKLIPTSFSYFIFLLKIKFNKIIITDLDMNYKYFLKMCFSLKIIPSNNYTFLENRIKINDNLYDLNIRKKIVIDKECKNKFEDFLFKNIFLDMPITYLEGYKIIKKKVNPILTEKKKIILCNYIHLASDIWKIWIAEMLQRKSKLITYMHGGGFPLQSYDLECSEPKHELKISTKRISWFRHSNNPSVQLSPLKALKFKDIKYTSNKNKFLSVVLPGMYLHILNPEGYPYAGENIDELEDCFELIKNVNPKINDMTKFRVFNYKSPALDTYDPWYAKKIILKKYGESKLWKNEIKMYDILNQSKFVIVKYPMTTLSEALIANVPFALFYDPSHWDLHKDCENMINIMRKNKLYFEDPKQLSNHLNNIWPATNEWWNSQNVLDARNYLKNTTANLNKNWTNEWVTFLRNIN